jgi:hypothetical protein
MRRLAMLLGVLLTTLAGVFAPGIPAQAQNRLCFAEVPDCIEGRFAEYWQQNGGLPVFGYPIGPAAVQQFPNGAFLVQTFERNRFELHPENARPYDVLLGRLGDDRLRQLGRPWENEPKAPTTSQSGCAYFGQTQHLVCGPILAYWRANGLNLDNRRGFSEAESLALFGLPLTEARVENGSDGRPYLTQWFERARFEVHPEIRPDAVLLGLLGRETAQGGAVPPPAPPATPAPPTPADPCADVPAPVSGSVNPNCGPGGTIFTFVGRGFQPGENVGVYITPDQSVFGAPFQVEADGSGVADGVSFRSDPSFPTGIYAITYEGVRSKHKAILYFKIIPRNTQPPSGDLPPIPASQNATATPDNGPAGTTFRFVGRGFQPGENVGVYITAPDQSVFGAPFQVEADGNGVSEEVFLETAPGFPTGIYAVTFEGVRSKNKAIAYFRINP